jgi:hypothetical protein
MVEGKDKFFVGITRMLKPNMCGGGIGCKDEPSCEWLGRPMPNELTRVHELELGLTLDGDHAKWGDEAQQQTCPT